MLQQNNKTMAIQTYYIKGKSKKEINERIAQGKSVYGESFSMFGGAGTKEVHEMNNGDVIKIFDSYSRGNPIAKSYGNWDTKKQKIK